MLAITRWFKLVGDGGLSCRPERERERKAYGFLERERVNLNKKRMEVDVGASGEEDKFLCFETVKLN